MWWRMKSDWVEGNTWTSHTAFLETDAKQKWISVVQDPFYIKSCKSGLNLPWLDQTRIIWTTGLTMSCCSVSNLQGNLWSDWGYKWCMDCKRVVKVGDSYIKWSVNIQVKRWFIHLCLFLFSQHVFAEMEDHGSEKQLPWYCWISYDVQHWYQVPVCAPIVFRSPQIDLKWPCWYERHCHWHSRDGEINVCSIRAVPSFERGQNCRVPSSSNKHHVCFWHPNE